MRAPFVLAYNTNGFAHHRLDDAIAILGSLGYRGVAITLDVQHLDPKATSRRELGRVRSLLERHRMSVVIETGARFVLRPTEKHQPTLLSRRGWRERAAFIEHAIDVAAALGAGVVSLWSGTPDHRRPFAEHLERLAARLGPLADAAARRDVVLGFEPEPGMLIDRMSRYRRLRRLVDHEHFALTLDVGHLHVTGEVPAADVIRAFASDLVHVHAEDMVAGVHEHLPFGTGEMDYGPILAALREVDYAGQVAVELSRDSHRAVDAARESIAYLRSAARYCGRSRSRKNVSESRSSDK